MDPTGSAQNKRGMAYAGSGNAGWEITLVVGGSLYLFIYFGGLTLGKGIKSGLWGGDIGART